MEERIEAVEARLTRAAGAGDAAGVAAEYAEDAVLLIPRHPPVEGRPAIEAYYRDVLDRWDLALESRTEEVLVRDDLAVLRGSVVQRIARRGSTRTAVRRLRHLLVLRRRGDGGWSVARDMVQDAEAEGGGLLARLLRRLTGR